MLKQQDGQLSEEKSKGVLLLGYNLLKRQRLHLSEMDDVLYMWIKSFKQDATMCWNDDDMLYVSIYLVFFIHVFLWYNI